MPGRNMLKRILVLIATAASAFSSAAGTAPTDNKLANMSYSGVYETSIHLQDGRWEGQPFVPDGASRPSAGLVESFRLNGDLNGDGVDETAVLLWESSGGSGTRLYLAIVGQRDEEIMNLATVLVGDRVQVRSGHIRNGKIELDIVQQGPDDAACCPSQLATRSWALSDAGLTEEPARITGKLSPKTLTGPTWVLTRLTRDDAVPEQPEINLAFTDERVSGKGGCNRYFAGVTTGKLPGELNIGQSGSTRMACPAEVMDLEARYLDALSRVTNYGFLVGQLALTWQKDDTRYTMLFKPQAAE